MFRLFQYGEITGEIDESTYGSEVDQLAVWCSLNNAELISGDDR